MLGAFSDPVADMLLPWLLIVYGIQLSFVHVHRLQTDTCFRTPLSSHPTEQPSPFPRTVEFQSAVENSDHVITCFVALRFWKYRPRGTSPSFFPRPRKAKKKTEEKFPPASYLYIFSDKAFPGLPVIASAGFTRRQHRFAFFSLGRATENTGGPESEGKQL